MPPRIDSIAGSNELAKIKYKTLPKWDRKPGTYVIPAMHATPKLVPQLL